MDDSLGSSYRLVEILGEGAMGTVWRALDRRTGEQVAAKLLHPRLTREPDTVTRFVRERTVLIRLRHPGIVSIRDFVLEGDRIAIVMDLVTGGDLSALVRRSGTLPAATAATMTASLAEALAHAHERGVVHCDVKPANVLVDQATGALRLTDFGVSRILHSSTASTTGSVAGTPVFLAPEVLRGERPSPAADVYALGMLLYELLAGRPPFAGGHGLSALHSALHMAPRRLEGMSDTLWGVIDACTAKEPAARPPLDQLTPVLHAAARTEPQLPLPPVSRDEPLSATAIPLPNTPTSLPQPDTGTSSPHPGTTTFPPHPDAGPSVPRPDATTFPPQADQASTLPPQPDAAASVPRPDATTFPPQADSSTFAPQPDAGPLPLQDDRAGAFPFQPGQAASASPQSPQSSPHRAPGSSHPGFPTHAGAAPESSTTPGWYPDPGPGTSIPPHTQTAATSPHLPAHTHGSPTAPHVPTLGQADSASPHVSTPASANPASPYPSTPRQADPTSPHVPTHPQANPASPHLPVLGQTNPPHGPTPSQMAPAPPRSEASSPGGPQAAAVPHSGQGVPQPPGAHGAAPVPPRGGSGPYPVPAAPGWGEATSPAVTRTARKRGAWLAGGASAAAAAAVAVFIVSPGQPEPTPYREQAQTAALAPETTAPAQSALPPTPTEPSTSPSDLEPADREELKPSGREENAPPGHRSVKTTQVAPKTTPKPRTSTSAPQKKSPTPEPTTEKKTPTPAVTLKPSPPSAPERVGCRTWSPPKDGLTMSPCLKIVGERAYIQARAKGKVGTSVDLSIELYDSQANRTVTSPLRCHDMRFAYEGEMEVCGWYEVTAPRGIPYVARQRWKLRTATAFGGGFESPELTW